MKKSSSRKYGGGAGEDDTTDDVAVAASQREEDCAEVERNTAGTANGVVPSTAANQARLGSGCCSDRVVSRRRSKLAATMAGNFVFLILAGATHARGC